MSWNPYAMPRRCFPGDQTAKTGVNPTQDLLTVAQIVTAMQVTGTHSGGWLKASGLEVPSVAEWWRE